jgi:D-alanyl-D-alanine carboxypeptidase (penicillin-binding protein 5/6)
MFESVYIRLLTVVLFLQISGNLQADAGIIPAPPELNASSWLLMDYDSGQVLAKNNIDNKLPPASLTKIMTVYVAASELAEGHLSLSDVVTVSEKAWRTPGSRMFIEVNDKVTVEELLKGIIIQSGNDASVALAEFIAGSEEVFASQMNAQAKRLGMLDTHYMNSTGLPHKNHYTTASDLAILARAMIRDYPDIYSWHSIREYTYNKIKQNNRNNLLWRDNSVDGIKTGHTEEAGYCLVSSAQRDDMRLIAVVMGTDGSEARIKASQSLLNYGFRFYETRKLYSSGETVTSVRIWKGDRETLALGLDEDLFITVPRGQYRNLDASVEKNGRIFAPVTRGQEQGMLQVSLAGKDLLKVPVVALEDVQEGPLLHRLKEEVRLFFE